MRLMIASDIHGSYDYLKMLLDRMEQEKCEKMLILGDILYHGPRNDLPLGYAPKKVAEALNAIKEKIITVRGNCEADVDQMMLNFPVLQESAYLMIDGTVIYATHGHKFGETNPPPISGGEILLCGHTHVPKIAEYEGYTYLNPGSVSIPKENSRHSCMIFENGVFTWKDIETGDNYMEYSV